MANGTQRSDVLGDPKFFALPEADQVKILSNVDPQFGKLPASDQGNILRMRARTLRAKPTIPKPAPKPAAPPEEKSLYERAKGYVGDLFLGTPAAKPAPAPGESPAASAYFQKVGVEAPAAKPAPPPVLPPTPIGPPEQPAAKLALAPETKAPPQFMAPGPKPAGLVEQGNIDIANRPRHVNADGSISSVLSKSWNFDGVEVLLPTIAEDGHPMKDEEAIQQYKKTGRHLGKFKSSAEATAYAKALHVDQEERGKRAVTAKPAPPPNFELLMKQGYTPDEAWKLTIGRGELGLTQQEKGLEQEQQRLQAQQQRIKTSSEEAVRDLNSRVKWLKEESATLDKARSSISTPQEQEEFNIRVDVHNGLAKQLQGDIEAYEKTPHALPKQQVAAFREQAKKVKADYDRLKSQAAGVAAMFPPRAMDTVALAASKAETIGPSPTGIGHGLMGIAQRIRTWNETGGQGEMAQFLSPASLVSGSLTALGASIEATRSAFTGKGPKPTSRFLTEAFKGAFEFIGPTMVLSAAYNPVAFAQGALGLAAFSTATRIVRKELEPTKIPEEYKDLISVAVPLIAFEGTRRVAARIPPVQPNETYYDYMRWYAQRATKKLADNWRELRDRIPNPGAVAQKIRDRVSKPSGPATIDVETFQVEEKPPAPAAPPVITPAPAPAAPPQVPRPAPAPMVPPEPRGAAAIAPTLTPLPAEVPTNRPHLDNAVETPVAGQKWSDYLAEKAELIDSKQGIDHYRVGKAHYIVSHRGEVFERSASDAERGFKLAVFRAKRERKYEGFPAELEAPSAVNAQKAIEEGGGKFVGPQENLKGGVAGYLFNDPQTGSTLFVKPDEATAEGVRAKLEESRKAFEKPVAPPRPERRLDRALRADVEEHMKLSGETDREAALRDVLEARGEAAKPVAPEVPRPPEAVAAPPSAVLHKPDYLTPGMVAQPAPPPISALLPERPPVEPPVPAMPLAAPPSLAGITTDESGHRTVADPKAFMESLAAGAAIPEGTLTAPIGSVALVPQEMQFRSAEGQLARRAARGEIRTWEPMFAGAVDVWFDPKDKKIKVVNGHHRVEYAQRLGQQNIELRFLSAASAAEARSKGALKNIAEGTATPYDAAVFFRSSGYTPEELAGEGLPITGSLAHDGLSLARLADDLFERVRKGEMTERTGIAIGASLESPELQRGLADLVEREAKRGKKLSPEEIRLLAEGRVRRAGQTVERIETLFGTEDVVQSNAVEAARLEAYVKKQLGADRRLFGFVSNEQRAYTLSKAGNVITVDENRKIAQAATAAEEAFGRLLYRAGPVEDAILAGAARLKRGEDQDAVRQSTYRAVYEAVRNLIGPAEAGAPAGREEGAGGRPETPQAVAPTVAAPGATVPREPAAAPAYGRGAPADVARPGGVGPGLGVGTLFPAEQGLARPPERRGPEGAGGVVQPARVEGEELEAPRYGERNRLFTKEEMDRRRERLRSKLGRVSVGLDPETLADVTYAAGFHFEAGARTFADWSEKMLGELGEWVKPHLERLWPYVSRRVKTDEVLAKVQGATIHVPVDARQAVRNPAEWSLSLDEANIQSNAPAPKTKLSEEIAKKLVYFGQRELTELALSALTRPGIEKPGFVLAASTGTGKTYMAAAILSELKPETALILTTNQGLVNKTIRVADEFGVTVQRLPGGATAPPGPGTWIATYATAIGRKGLADYPWKLVVADESGAARRWWVSETGATLRRMAQAAEKTLYMSATPFHTPIELGYADNLGVWKPRDFESWVRQFGVYQDESGDWIAPANPKRFAKLRLQMTEAGVFINLTPSLDGYTTAFGVVPLSEEQRTNLGNIKRGFDIAIDYFMRRRRPMMARAARAGRVVYSKAYLERTRLPEAVELAKKARAQGWHVGLFTETRSGSEGIYEFLKEVDEANGGAITRLLPPLPDVMKTLETAFGGEFANFSGRHSELRQSELDAFNDGRKPVLAATYAAGGLGVDMNDASGERPRFAIFLGPPWSGVMFDQAMGRFWRFGTKSDVFAVFLTSDSKAEFQLVHGKVIPRLESLRALVKGVHSDPFTQSMRSIEDALDYEHGEAATPDADDFVVKVNSNSILAHNQIEIPSADTAKNRGLAIARLDDPVVEGEGFGRNNKVFTAESKERHEENFREHLDELHGGFDPTMVKDLVYVAGYYFEGGIREFGKWSQALTDRFGEGVKPYLAGVWKTVSERGGLAAEPRKGAKPKLEEPALPGFETAVEEQKAAAGAEQGRALTEKIGLPPVSIDMSAGKMEREAPLFRGTEAAPQAELFGAPVPAPAPLGAEPTRPRMATEREALEEFKRIEATIREGRGTPDMVAVAAARAQGAGLHKTTFWLAMKRAGVPVEQIRAATKGTWEVAHVETPEAELRWKTGRAARMAPVPLGAGPGAKTAGPSEMAGTPVAQLTGAMKAASRAEKGRPKPGPIPTVEPAPPPDNLPPQEGTAGKVLGVLRSAWTDLSPARPFTAFEDALGHFQGNLQRNTFELRKFVNEMRKDFPDKLRREAMTNWVQAEGNPETLRHWASMSKGRTKKGYEAALALTDAEKLEAQNIRNLFDEYWEIAKEAGILESFIENYLPQLRKPTDKATPRILAEVLGGILRTDFRFAKKRVFETYFEGEQKGFPALDKDIGFLVTTYVRSLVKAIEGRGLVRALSEQSAKDGRPLATVAGVGRIRGSLTSKEQAHLVIPQVKPEDAFDYQRIAHPALRRWLWVGKDAKNNPIFLEGDMIIHPEIYRHLNNVLSRSAFRRPDAAWYWKAGGAVLKGSSFIKQTFLGPFATFHQAQVGMHGVMHRVRPFAPPEINFAEADQKGLVDHGLVVADADGSVAFEEGLTAGGLWHQVPWAGKYLRAYTESLFQSYIPRLKMSMGLEALRRNRARYGKQLSEDQILRMTSEQANAAFGELNYIMLGRNKTIQDALRLVLLAPDFTEARARFVGQGAKGYGQEQLVALALGATILMVAAGLLSKLFGSHWDKRKPFSVRYGKYELDLRTIQGDVLSMYDDWGQFLEARLNPATAKPALEALRGRDWRGMPRTFEEQVRDFFTGLVPISFQGLTTEGRELWQSAINAFGLRVRKHHTPAEKLALQYLQENIAGRPRRHETAESTARRKAVAKLVKDKREGREVPSGAVDALLRSGDISPSDATRIRLVKKGQSDLESLFWSLSLRDKLDVWEKASPEERTLLRPAMHPRTRRDHQELRSLPEKEREELRNRLRAAQAEAPEFAPEAAPKPAPEPTYQRMYEGGTVAPPPSQ